MSSEEKKAIMIGDHRRQWRDCLYVYPVIARRSRGLSIGINISPGKSCNFDCLYCQIDRTCGGGLVAIDVARLESELQLLVGEAVNGGLWREAAFSGVPAELRRLNDIAFSGDGEPTAHKDFDKFVNVACDAIAHSGVKGVKLVVITNATLLDCPQFQRALPILDRANGQVWAKLDAGTEEYFRKICRPADGVKLSRIVDSIGRLAARNASGESPRCEVIIQTLFTLHDGKSPDSAEIDAYCRNLQAILNMGGRLSAVQLHTVARKPADTIVGPLDNRTLDDIADRIRRSVPSLKVETYYGAGGAAGNK